MKIGCCLMALLAWVLWDHFVEIDTLKTLIHEPIGAYDTYTECHEAMRFSIEQTAKNNTGRFTMFTGVGYTITNLDGAPAINVALICLPDTVDPRGPKQ